jgi:threonine/homoserine efflux transporter RhtA
MHSSKNNHSKMMKNHYFIVPIMAILSFISMYILMYSMVNTFGNIYNNLNQVYMAALMTAPMVIFEISLMRSMFKNKKWNIIIIAVSIAVLIASFAFIREQTAIGDEQFIMSMVPHHSSAILMCEKASIQDPELKALCEEIISSQQAEIDQMEAILNRMNASRSYTIKV